MSDAIESLFADGSHHEPGSTAHWLAARAAAGDAPYIAWLSVEGFGSLADVEVELAPGLNVIVGQNEAGKSTLFDFLTGVLFGFPRQKADESFRLPVSGGRHGGKVAVAHADGLLIVERHGLPSKQLVLTHGDGSPGDEGELVRLLGGSTRDLFRTVFALDLDDLRSLSGLAAEDVREVLFSSSVLGQRRSAAKALAMLDGRRGELAKPRQGGRANDYLADLSRTKRELAQAQSEVAGYLGMRSRAESCARRLEELRTELEAARRRQRDYELLQRCWTTVLNRQEAADALSEMDPISREEHRALELADRVGEIRAGLSGQLERLDRAEGLRVRRAPLSESVTSRVGRLGPWSMEAASDESVELAAARDELDRLLSRCTAARTAHESASRAVGQAATELGELPDPETAAGAGLPGAGLPGAGLPDERSLQQGLAELRELRGLVSEHEGLSRELEHAAERARLSELSRPAERGLASSIPALAAAIALFAIGGALMATSRALLGAVAMVVGIVVALSVFITRRGSPAGHSSPRRAASGGSGVAAESGVSAESGVPRELAPLDAPAGQFDGLNSIPQRLRQLGHRIRKVADSHGIGDPVAAASVERAISELEWQLETRRRIDQQSERRQAAEQRVAAARAAVAAGARELGAALEEVRLLMVRCGVPGDLIASSLRDGNAAKLGDFTDPAVLLRELVELRERIEGLARLDRDIEELESDGRRFDSQVREMAEHLRLDIPEPTAQGSGDELLSNSALDRLVRELESVAANARQHEQARRRLEETITSSDGELDRVLGRGESADALRRDLETGRVREWAASADAAAEDVRRLEADHDEALREHERLLAGLSELERSDEVGRLEARLAGFEADLDETMREYLATSMAHLLVQRTLRRYEEERQPEVLTRAGEHFSRLTGGRYLRVVASSTSEGASPNLQVLQESGSRIEAHHLSRGTIEQLYLCLRLALAESFGQRIVPLPLVLDDVLVNFDPGRQEAVAAELAETARQHQLIFLTCHPHVAELLATVGRSVGTPTATIELARCRSAGGGGRGSSGGGR